MKNTGNNPTPALRDPDISPTRHVLSETLGSNFAQYERLVATVTSPEMGMEPEWRYYNDGKSWLCKVTFGQKTVFWLSVWDDHTVRASFFFAQSKTEGVLDLEIGDGIKDEMRAAIPSGRLVPLVLELSDSNMDDIITIANYKKRLK